jgi:hypothetical protein
MTPHGEALGVAVVQLVIGGALNVPPKLARNGIGEQVRLHEVRSSNLERNASATLNVGDPSHEASPPQQHARWATSRPGGFPHRQR